MYPVLLISGATLLFVIVSFLYLRAYLIRRTGQERILAEFREEVDKILMALDQTTERDISLIEEREKKLKAVLEDIDKRLNLYIRELGNLRENGESYAELRQKAASSGQSYQELGKNRYRHYSQEAPPADSTPQDNSPDRNGPDSSSPAYPLPDFKLNESPSKGSQIRDFLKSGLAPPIIASRLGISIAEVEFAAALLERRES